MIVTQLNIQHLRCFSSLQISPGKGLNLVVGNNGSGKTSVLEALYLLGNGRSFRHKESSPLIQQGEQEAQVFARLLDDQGSNHNLGLARAAKTFKARYDGEDISKRSELVKLLPLQWIGPTPQDLVIGPPDRRRQFLDYGLFHVEQKFLETSQRYGRALVQRNESLRKGLVTTLDTWDASILESGELLSQMRKQLVSEIQPLLQTLIKQWALDIELKMQYAQGWPEGLALADSIKRSRDRDIKHKSTHVGPHRADLVLQLQTGKAGSRLSRGQLKMVAVALQFSLQQVLIQREHAAPVLLIDDVPAELDTDNREKLLCKALELYPQVIAATLAESDIPSHADYVFHVEQANTSHR